jgi:branched-chain amino acid transport system ATP-binding protein
MEVGDCHIVALLGPNGSGKSTLMRTIVGLNQPWAGRVAFAGEEVTRLQCHERVRRGLGMVPPGRRLFLGLSVEENLRMGAYLFRDRGLVREGLERAYDYFPVLRDHRNRVAGRLSGGEQQMCALARGLMSRPKLLMIDELSLGLAPKVVAVLTEALEVIRTEERISIVLVEQDVSAALAISDYAYILAAGSVAFSGTPDELREDGHLRHDITRVFLGLA